MNSLSINTCPLAKGIDFDKLDQLKHACRTWAVKQVFEFKTIRASKTRYEIACKGENCPWHLSARSVGGPGGFFRIKSFVSDHSCFGINHSGHQQATAKFICDFILPRVQQESQYRPSSIVKHVKTELRIDISYDKAFRAKQLALEVLHGTHGDAYKAMPKYCTDIEQTNPNSVVRLDITSENRFRRVFISYGACAMGFANCRPLLGLDGTHLKTTYRGILLSAIGIDAKGQLFPIAYAVVDIENIENWFWMLELLRRIVEENAPQFLQSRVFS